MIPKITKVSVDDTVSHSPFDPQHLRPDVLAGLVTFLVALPLCLGIALASGAPPITGIVSGIVAGLVVGWFSGAQVMISGPAAGLTAVVAIEIAALGSLEALLLAVVVAGLIQIVLGLAQGGFVKSFVPTSVVRGLLSAIGVILILKQIPHLFGHDTDYEGEMSFFQPDRENTFSELFKLLGDLHPGAILVGLSSLALIWIWGRWRFTRSSGIPVQLAVVAFGMAAVAGLRTLGAPWMIEASHRVQLPVAESFAGIMGFLHSPDFSQIGNPAIYSAALTIAMVASIQALLTTEAVDRLDRRRRTTPANRELVAQGIGNCVSGLLGGLPMTCEIVRSSVNIDAGAVTKRAAIVHGLLLAAALLFFPRLINLIPLSALAAILIATGLRLASPAVFAEMRRAGRYQFIPYLITLVAIVFTDPLQGILIGLVTSLGFILWSNQRRPMRLVVEQHLAGDVTRIELANQVSFLNRAELRRVLDGMPRGRHVLLDASNSVYIDPDILETVREYRNSIGPARGVEISTKGFRPKYEIDDEIRFVDYTSRELQQDLTPARAFEYLRAGNQRFSTGKEIKRDLGRQAGSAEAGQHPVAVVLSCVDSPSPAERLFDTGLGDIFSVRVSGNVATTEVLGSMEFASAVAGAKLVVVLGHTRCGAVDKAIQATCRPDEEVAPGCVHLAPILESVGRSVDPASCWLSVNATNQQVAEVADGVAARNVARVVGEIRHRSGVLEGMIRAEQLGIVGMIFDVSSGATSVVPGTMAGLPPGMTTE